ncbi:MAG: peroxiredoxin [Candidatus Chromulinivorax sp.]
MKNLSLYFYSIILLCLAIYPLFAAKENLLNKKAPEFKAQAILPDGSIDTIDLQDYLGKNVVLYFYPKDNSTYCSIQAKKFRDNIEKLKKNNIYVIGINSDSLESHKKFQEKYQLAYPLISDKKKGHKITKLYNAAGIFFTERKTFLIDTNGVIFKIFDHVDIKNQIDDIIDAVKNHKK